MQFMFISACNVGSSEPGPPCPAGCLEWLHPQQIPPSGHQLFLDISLILSDSGLYLK